MTATASKAVIVAAARTAIGTSRRGSLANVPAIELAKPVVAAAIERSGLDAMRVDDLVLAESLQGGGAETGARMVTSAIYELRRRGGGIGVLSMCAGGGMGAAMVIEVA